MANHILYLSKLILIINFLFCFLISCNGSSSEDKQIYIVYMGDRINNDISHLELHTSMLKEVLGSEDGSESESLVYSYHRSFNGFAAKLTYDQMVKLSGMEGVVSVFPNEKFELHTTKSWSFMGFTEQVKRSNIESNVIVGVLDTGIWPESDSFSDDGFGPPPKQWKGICRTDSNFTCNNKIIGARYYRSSSDFSSEDIPSPRDTIGHGTHTASTAAGNLVTASLEGLAAGTARGAVPSARIAVYKVCWSDGCPGADILAAFDDAIADGVDIISLSVGASAPVDYLNYSIAIGAFHAMKHGVLTSASAGNSGPKPSTIVNFAPWLLSVAASTIDRKFVTKVKLGYGKIYEGVSINTNNSTSQMYQIIYAGDAPNTSAGFTGYMSRYCKKNSLDPKLVKGKIVLCDSIGTGEAASSAGAVGAIMLGDGLRDVAFNFPVPTSYLETKHGLNLFKYLNTTRKPLATILKSTEKTNDLSPFVASFSSRGPNPKTNDLLAPDVAAPGVDILAAWSQRTTVTGMAGDGRIVPYNIISGTSMACPHATGAAAYVKSFHPDWSPAAIKSALMTTAFPMSSKTNSDAEFAYGAGHINPVRAVHPGLVFDAGEADYIQFLCGQGYTNEQIKVIAGNTNITCSNVAKQSVRDLNYPSFTLSGASGQVVHHVFHRTVTNVGKANSSYEATLMGPKDMHIEVNPREMSFNSIGEKKSFVVKVRVKLSSSVLSGALVWDDGNFGKHKVRSPIVAYVVA